MKRRSWIWKSLLGILVLLGASLFVHRAVRFENCSECFTGRTVRYWAVGWPMQCGRPWVRLLESHEQGPDSVAQRELFGPGHHHEWKGWGGNCSSLFGVVQISHGRPPWNRFLCEFDGDPGFRAFIEDKIHQGELSKEDARSLAAFREPKAIGNRWPQGLPNRATPLPPQLTEEERRLIELGRSLFDGYFGEDPHQDWWWNW